MWICCTSSGKDMVTHLIVRLIKKISQYFSKPFIYFGGNINVIVDLSSYATKVDVKWFQKLKLQMCTKIKFTKFKNWS